MDQVITERAIMIQAMDLEVMDLVVIIVPPMVRAPIFNPLSIDYNKILNERFKINVGKHKLLMIKMK